KTQPATGETYPKSDLFNKAWLRLNQPLKTIHMLTVTNVHPEIYIKIVISGDSGQAPLKGRFYN
ncbi:hypothetical protein, partial [Citrobacter freundii]|uniref:hypothetical protein n=1 Tax=Citrobacter freundii TaxID=546 RepID=UPI0023B18C5B